MAAPPDLLERWVNTHKDENNADTGIPGQSTYDQESAQAWQAYNAAVAQMKAQRDAMYHDYGFLTNGKVDPHNQFGRYQTLLGGEGSQLDASQENAQQRGLSGPGLGNQQESALRFQQAGTNLQFQRQVSDIGQNYAMGMQQAQAGLGTSLWQAKQGLINAGINNNAFTPAAPAQGPTPSASLAKSLAGGMNKPKLRKPAWGPFGNPNLNYGPWR